VAQLLTLGQQVRRDGETRQTDLVLPRGLGSAPSHVHTRVAALSSRTVLVLVDDRTRERRVSRTPARAPASRP
jgi:two-component system, OmpR family, sensor histidine kinase SenX3